MLELLLPESRLCFVEPVCTQLCFSILHKQCITQISPVVKGLEESVDGGQSGRFGLRPAIRHTICDSPHGPILPDSRPPSPPPPPPNKPEVRTGETSQQLEQSKFGTARSSDLSMGSTRNVLVTEPGRPSSTVK